MAELTERQKAFVEAYIARGFEDIKGAAQEAEVDYATAKYWLKNNKDIKAEIAARREELWKRYEITAEELIQRVAKQVQQQELLAPYKKVNPDNGKIYWDWRGAPPEIIAIAPVNGTEKDILAAMSLLAKLLGLDKGKVEISGPEGGPVQIEMSDMELARRMQFILAKAEKETK